jgi:hypothetical protein
LDRVLMDAQKIPYIVEGETKGFTREELRLIRSGQLAAGKIADKLGRAAVQVTAHVLQKQYTEVRVPNRAELLNTFIFRSSLCACVWVMHWISVGGAKGVAPTNLRNDMVDLNFATFATYFDGLLTDDRKATIIYRDAAALLRAFGGYCPAERAASRDSAGSAPSCS